MNAAYGRYGTATFGRSYGYRAIWPCEQGDENKYWQNAAGGWTWCEMVGYNDLVPVQLPGKPVTGQYFLDPATGQCHQWTGVFGLKAFSEKVGKNKCEGTDASVSVLVGTQEVTGSGKLLVDSGGSVLVDSGGGVLVNSGGGRLLPIPHWFPFFRKPTPPAPDYFDEAEWQAPRDLAYYLPEQATKVRQEVAAGFSLGTAALGAAVLIGGVVLGMLIFGRKKRSRL